jgi:DNA invertase Pin-like site-specific DNA recombinase
VGRGGVREERAIVKVYRDHGISGAKGRDKRRAFDALCRAATRREFDVVMAWSVDRLGRSLQDLVGFLSEIHALGIDLFLHQQGLDTTTPSGKAMFQMMGVFAEFERAMIQERPCNERDRANRTRFSQEGMEAPQKSPHNIFGRTDKTLKRRRLTKRPKNEITRPYLE